MHIRPSGILLVACAAIAFAGAQLATPMITAAAASSPTSRAPAHPRAYVPLRGSKGTGFDRVFTNMDYNGGPVMPSNRRGLLSWSLSGIRAYPAARGHPRLGVGCCRYWLRSSILARAGGCQLLALR